MRTRILLPALFCLLIVQGASRADGSPAGEIRSCCGNIGIPVVRPSEVAPDLPGRTAAGSSSRAAPERPCGTAGDHCAISSAEWTIYADSSPGAPDFWSAPSVEVQEITVCEHGLQFLFPAVQDGRRRLAALVFPVPTPQLLAERLSLPEGTPKARTELEHFQRRYASLMQVLDRLFGWDGLARRQLPAGAERPRIWPAPLVLKWEGANEPLRGYLDVYFTDPEEAAVIAAAPEERDEPAAAAVGAIAAAAPTVPLSLGIAPNPGGRGDYTVSFGLPAAGPAKLEMYDVTGRRVVTLIDEDRPAGAARLRWNGRSSSGRRLAAGVYFARLQTEAGARTAKLVHLAR